MTVLSHLHTVYCVISNIYLSEYIIIMNLNGPRMSFCSDIYWNATMSNPAAVVFPSVVLGMALLRVAWCGSDARTQIVY